MKLVVIGCGRVGAELAHRFARKDHDVTVVDHQSSQLESLSADFTGRVVEGYALHEDVLHRAGVPEADGVAVVTDNDSLNAVVAHLIRSVYHVPRVVVRNYDPRRMPLLEAFGLQAVGSIMWGASRLEEILCNVEGEAVFSAGNGEIELFELEIPADWEGRTLSDLVSGVDCIPAAITRNGTAALPKLDGTLAAGDLLHVSTSSDNLTVLASRLAKGA